MAAVEELSAPPDNGSKKPEAPDLHIHCNKQPGGVMTKETKNSILCKMAFSMHIALHSL